ncbi:MAG: hypothetical protein H5U03_00155 [Clostridia bacterium]|nr:hypothetical protein [Clostridia bacterium]
MLRGLGNKIRLTLKQWFVTALEDARDWFTERIANAIMFVIETIEQHQIKMVGRIVDDILDTPEVPESVKDALRDAREGKYEAGAFLLGTVGNTAAGTIASGIFGTLFGPAINRLRAAIPSSLLSPSEAMVSIWRGALPESDARSQLRMLGYSDKLIDVFFKIMKPLLGPDELTRSVVRGLMNEDEYKKVMAWMGYDSQQADIILKLQRTLLGVGDCRELYLRGVIDEDEHDARLKQLGIDPDDIEKIKQLYYFIPGTSDLIRLAVREAWSDETARRFGYDEDFPEEFAEWAQKQGLSREWAIRFWRAHWELPSPTMAYEMLHRGLITEDDLKLLLKVQDYPAFWRDKLVKLSYTPFTRVDIRRMYQLGLLSREEVFKAYKDIGYDDEKAEKLTLFAISGATESEKDLTRSDILGAYADALLSRDDAKTQLVAMGYSEDEAELLLAREDYKLSKKQRDAEISAVKSEFTKGIISEGEAYNRLATLGLQAKEIERQIAIWKPETKAKTATPSLAQLTQFLKAKIIDINVYREELRGRGYSDKYIDWFVKLYEKGQEPKGE